MTTKKNLFEYFLLKVVEWHCRNNNISTLEFNNHPSNDLSKLKLIKLHFFACSTNNDALDFYDNFYAMPYGHVESSVYPELKTLEYFVIDTNKLTCQNLDADFSALDPDKLMMIDVSVASLERKNKDLINYSPFSLVELSHKWFSWKYTFEEARRENLFSKKISLELIKQEAKFYNL